MFFRKNIIDTFQNINLQILRFLYQHICVSKINK